LNFFAGVNAVLELLKTIDNHVPTPVRELDKPFMLPVENVYSIAGKSFFCKHVVYLLL